MRLPNLEITKTEDGLVRLTQEDGQGNRDIVDLHPLQIRLIAEKLGLLPAPNNDEQVAQKQLALIASRIKTTLIHVDGLGEWWTSLPNDTGGAMEGLARISSIEDLLKICGTDAGLVFEEATNSTK